MEDLILQTIVHGAGNAAEEYSRWCAAWEWSFWIGVLVGVVGAIVMAFMKPAQEA